jgi:hypothetical protein
MSIKFIVHSSQFIVILLAFLLLPTTNSQLTTTIAQTFSYDNVFDISDKDAKAGDIVIFDPTNGIIRTTTAYDIRIFGVLQDQSAIVLKRSDGTGKPVAKSGISKVNISLANGPIKKGDYITSGTELGVGIKATLSGNVLGIALEDSSQSSKYQQSCVINPTSCPKDQIDVSVRPEYAELSNPRSVDRILEYIGIAFFKNSQDPQGFGKIVKNVIAGLIMLLAIFFGLFIINRALAKSVEAIGRNPLAKSSIQIALILNIFIVVAVIIGSIIAGLIVLKL